MVLSHTGLYVAEAGLLSPGTVLFELWRCYYLLLSNSLQKHLGDNKLLLFSSKRADSRTHRCHFPTLQSFYVSKFCSNNCASISFILLMNW